MMNFQKYMNLMAQKKCPEGFRFDEKLQVCVPKGQGRYYGAFGFGVGRTPTTSGEIENGETENGNADVANGMNGGSNGGNK
jgi:hypothetical protein